MDFAQFAQIPVIDGHIHFSHPEGMDRVMAVMESVPLARANLVSLPTPDQSNQNAAVVHFKSHYGDRVYISGALDYGPVFAHSDKASEILAAQVKTLKAVGFDGLKLIEGKPTARKRIPIPLEAPEYEGMWAALEELHMPAVFHVADPEEFWDEGQCPSWARERGWFYGDGTYPSKESLYAEVDRILARHPTLHTIFAHFYFLSADLERAAAFLDAHPSVCFDLTPGVEMYNHFTRSHDATRAFFLRYQDRLIYGTDISSGSLLEGEPGMMRSLGISWLVRAFLERGDVFAMPEGMEGWLDPDLEGYHGLALPHEVLHKIYHANLERLYGAAPAAMDYEAAMSALRGLRSAG